MPPVYTSVLLAAVLAPTVTIVVGILLVLLVIGVLLYKRQALAQSNKVQLSCSSHRVSLYICFLQGYWLPLSMRTQRKGTV